MSLARIKETFFRLPRYSKLIGAGSLILLISTLLPWYADLDTYRIGDQFLGVTGPASFVGIVILVLSAFSLWIFSYHLLERRVPRLPVREAIIHLFTAIESLFLLLLVNSIFFHPKFGVNITLKESRFGMTIAIVGAITVLIGGYLQNREQINAGDEVGKLEPLIKMEPVRPQPQASQVRPVGASRSVPVPQSVQSRQSAQTKIKPPITQRPPTQYVSKTLDPHRGFMFGEPRSTVTESVIHEAPAQETSRPEISEEESGEGRGEGGGTYMHRLDL